MWEFFRFFLEATMGKPFRLSVDSLWAWWPDRTEMRIVQWPCPWWFLSFWPPLSFGPFRTWIMLVLQRPLRLFFPAMTMLHRDSTFKKCRKSMLDKNTWNERIGALSIFFLSPINLSGTLKKPRKQQIWNAEGGPCQVVAWTGRSGYASPRAWRRPPPSSAASSPSCRSSSWRQASPQAKGGGVHSAQYWSLPVSAKKGKTTKYKLNGKCGNAVPRGGNALL